eukprot:UN15887
MWKEMYDRHKNWLEKYEEYYSDKLKSDLQIGKNVSDTDYTTALHYNR